MNGKKKQLIPFLILFPIFVTIYLLLPTASYSPGGHSIHQPSNKSKYLIFTPDVFPAIEGYVIKKSCPMDAKIVIVVISAPKNFDERKAIRDTYGKKLITHVQNVKLYFGIGIVSNETIMRRIKSEDDSYRDIVQWNISECYDNLIIKSIAMLKWTIDHCTHVQYLIKTDDDVYMNVEKLMDQNSFPIYGDEKSALGKHDSPSMRNSSRTLKPFTLGYPLGGVVVREGKWAVPQDVYPRDTYPEYVSGTGYIISKPAIGKIYEAVIGLVRDQTYISEALVRDQTYIPKLKYPIVRHEDIVITGIAPKVSNVSRLYDQKITFMWAWYHYNDWNVKKETLFIAHYLKPDELRAIDKIFSYKKSITGTELISESGLISRSELSSIFNSRTFPLIAISFVILFVIFVIFFIRISEYEKNNLK